VVAECEPVPVIGPEPECGPSSPTFSQCTSTPIQQRSIVQ
jgi:hypothetical protein